MRTPSLTIRIATAGALGLGLLATPAVAVAAEQPAATAHASSAGPEEPTEGFTITSNDEYTPGVPKTFTGTSVPNTRVSLKTEDHYWNRIPVGEDGTWTFTLSEAHAYTEGEHDVFVNPAGGGAFGRTVTLVPGEDRGVFRPLEVRSDPTYTPGTKTVVTGTATPGAKIRADLDGRRQFVVEADEQGTFSGRLGDVTTGQPRLTLVQTSPLGTDRIDVHVRPAAVFQQLALLSSATHRPGEPTRIEGKATADATVVVRVSGAPFAWTATADSEGGWAVELPQVVGTDALDVRVAQQSAFGKDRAHWTFTASPAAAERP